MSRCQPSVSWWMRSSLAFRACGSSSDAGTMTGICTDVRKCADVAGLGQDVADAWGVLRGIL